MPEKALKVSTVVKETFDTCLSQLAKIVLKLPTMVGENFIIHLSQMHGKALKLSTVVKKTFDINLSQMAKIALKLSTMVGEHFIIHLSQMNGKAFKCPPWLENLLILACLNWLK